MKMIYIKWDDSESSGSWIHYVKESKINITISHSFDSKNINWCGYLTISKSCILKKRFFKLT